jgi:enoyl-CoA hydratase/carnithine racemase
MLQHIRYDRILELKLARPPANAFNLELLTALNSALESAQDEGCEAVILSGAPGLFSGGLDVPTLLMLDREGVIATWGMFMRVCATLAGLPVPVVAALTGHSPAGGAVISLFCDYRVMARGNEKGEFKIGLNETQVGLVVPEAIQFALKRLVGERIGERLLVAGEMIDSSRALQIGMVDALCEIDAVVPHALAWLQAHLALPRQAMLTTRRMSRRGLLDAISAPAAQDIGAFIDGWYHPETQAVLKALVAKLGKG